ncbi:MAG: glycosyltransferase [Cyanobacteria bacterium]|nr:glycosyltransferase [Cyanobacteriota bacterium]
MKVSIVIPVKNQAASLYQCLLCLSRQTVKPSEIIDNSSEDIDGVCKEFGAVYEFESLPGSYAARNAGILRSSV